jgi:hypothetical protein
MMWRLAGIDSTFRHVSFLSICFPAVFFIFTMVTLGVLITFQRHVKAHPDIVFHASKLGRITFSVNGRPVKVAQVIAVFTVIFNL